MAVSRSNCLASFSLAFCAAFASRSLAFIAAISCLVNPLYSSQSTRVSWCNSSFLYYGGKKEKHAVSSLVFDRFCTPLSSPEAAVRFFDFSVGAKVVRGVGVLSRESTLIRQEPSKSAARPFSTHTHATGLAWDKILPANVRLSPNARPLLKHLSTMSVLARHVSSTLVLWVRPTVAVVVAMRKPESSAI